MKAYIVWPLAVVLPPLAIEGISRLDLPTSESLTVMWICTALAAIVCGLLFERSRRSTP